MEIEKSIEIENIQVAMKDLEGAFTWEEAIKPTKPSKIEKGYNIDGKLIVSMKDLEGAFTWDEAMEEVKKLGEGWRLPTKEELNLMYLHKDKIGGFVEGYYWSSTEYGAYLAWVQDFTNGNHYSNNKNFTNYYVRAVRSI